jgi:hypothetical protein
MVAVFVEPGRIEAHGSAFHAALRTQSPRRPEKCGLFPGDGTDTVAARRAENRLRGQRMKGKTLLALGTCLVLAIVIGLVLTKDRRPAARPLEFYHTPEGVNFTIQAQRPILDEALQKKDLNFIHGHMYYLTGLADALSGKLAGPRKARVEPKLQEFKRLAEELDNFSGRGNLEATKVSLAKLLGVFAELDAEFPDTPKSDSKP